MNSVQCFAFSFSRSVQKCHTKKSQRQKETHIFENSKHEVVSKRDKYSFLRKLRMCTQIYLVKQIQKTKTLQFFSKLDPRLLLLLSLLLLR